MNFALMGERDVSKLQKKVESQCQTLTAKYVDQNQTFTQCTCIPLQDLEPIKQETNRVHFDDGNPLTHPDSPNFNRYVLGTRLQTKSGNKGHKRETCAFHNLDLSQQGSRIKSMTQESMQNVRKFRSIQQDKLRNLESCFLANYILVKSTCSYP